MLGAMIGASALGSLATSAASMGFQAYQNQLDRDFNASQAQIQRDWEERMASSSYQRTVADMEKAGLNPAVMMAANQGVSSFGSGASASSSSSRLPKLDVGRLDFSNRLSLLDQAASTAKNVESAKKQGAGDELQKLWQDEVNRIERENAKRNAELEERGRKLGYFDVGNEVDSLVKKARLFQSGLFLKESESDGNLET